MRRGGQDPVLQVASQLDRASFVPMYYQLQEVIKEQIESAAWPPGGLLPSEPELARAFGVSRAVVRQALAILEDDHQIRRVRGVGTFVAHPKMVHRAGGLARLLETPRSAEVTIQVLDKRTAAGGRRIRTSLQSEDDEPLIRFATLLSLTGVPLSITYSFFRWNEVRWLDAETQVGRNLPADLVLADHLMSHGLASNVSLHVKPVPYYVSDATLTTTPSGRLAKVARCFLNVAPPRQTSRQRSHSQKSRPSGGLRETRVEPAAACSRAWRTPCLTTSGCV